MDHDFGYSRLIEDLDAVEESCPYVVKNNKDYVFNRILFYLSITRYLEERYHAVLAYAYKCEIARFPIVRLSCEQMDNEIKSFKLEHKNELWGKEDNDILSAMLKMHWDKISVNEEYYKRVKEYWHQSVIFRVEIEGYIRGLISEGLCSIEDNSHFNDNVFVLPDFYRDEDALSMAPWGKECAPPPREIMGAIGDYNEYSYEKLKKAIIEFRKNIYSKKDVSKRDSEIIADQIDDNQIERQYLDKAEDVKSKFIICHLDNKDLNVFQMMYEVLTHIQLGFKLDERIRFVYEPKTVFRISKDFIIYMTDDLGDAKCKIEKGGYLGCVITAKDKEKRRIPQEKMTIIPNSVVVITDVTSSSNGDRKEDKRTILKRISNVLIDHVDGDDETVKKRIAEELEKWITRSEYKSLLNWINMSINSILFGDPKSIFIVGPIKDSLSSQETFITPCDKLLVEDADESKTRDPSLRETIRIHDGLDTNYLIILAYTVQYYYDLSIEFVDFESIYQLDDEILKHLKLEPVEAKKRLFKRLKEIYCSGNKIVVASWTKMMLDDLIKRTNNERTIEKIEALKELFDKRENVNEIFMQPPDAKERRHKDHRCRNTASLFTIGIMASTISVADRKQDFMDAFKHGRRLYEEDLMKVEQKVRGQKEAIESNRKTGRLFLTPEERAHVSLEDLVRVLLTKHRIGEGYLK